MGMEAHAGQHQHRSQFGMIGLCFQKPRCPVSAFSFPLHQLYGIEGQTDMCLDSPNFSMLNLGDLPDPVGEETKAQRG